MYQIEKIALYNYNNRAGEIALEQWWEVPIKQMLKRRQQCRKWRILL